MNQDTSTPAPRIPVTVLTGFLGSGKTTLLNRILTEQHGRRIAVIENEFGEVGVDNELVVNADEEIFEMNNGCICCTVRGVDGEGWEAAKQEAVRRFADDGVAILPGEDFEAGSALRTLQLADRGGVFTLEITGAGAHALFTQQGPEEFAMQFRRDGHELHPLHAEAFAAAHSHDDSVSSVGIVEPGPVDAEKLQAWFSELLRDRGADIYRMKGILHVQGEPRRLIFQGVHMLFTSKPDRPWKSPEEAGNRLIFIGKNLDRAELNRGFRACLA
jgi:G3E family GTPase